MQIIKYPLPSQWSDIVERPQLDTLSLHAKVQQILDDIRHEGDVAVRNYVRKFDGVELDALEVTPQEWQEGMAATPLPLQEALHKAHDNIATFHASQQLHEQRVETSKGVSCWQKAVAIERVGLYVPGGTAPLFSTVLMLATPARIAGCKEIIICTPPSKHGTIHPAILYAAHLAGVQRIFKLGGVQAIGAMAYGTESVPKVYKIFGPGNQYVTAAKQIVSLRDVAIDMPAGPSEVQVIADKTSNLAFVASDFLSQAEHGVDSQSILLTTDEEIIAPLMTEIDRQLAELSRKEIAAQSLANSKLVVLETLDQLVDLTNEYAPEHLIIQSSNYLEIAERVVNAGSVFLGSYTPESAGDYASGTNHTLPTSGYAKAYSGVNLDSFVRKITFQEITQEGLLQLGETIETMAHAEQLDAHKNAVSVRLASLRKN